MLHSHLKVSRQHPCVHTAAPSNVDRARRVQSSQHSVRCFLWVQPLLNLRLCERIVVRTSHIVVAPLHVGHGWIPTNSDSAHEVLTVSAVNTHVLDLLHLLLLEKLCLFKLLNLLDGWKL